MFIAMPGDVGSQQWTKHSPSAQILHRVARLAAESYRILDCQLMERRSTSSKSDFRLIFRPALSVFDVVIHLRHSQCPRRHTNVDTVSAESVSVRGAIAVKKNRKKSLSMPAVDFDPVQSYLLELRDAFEDIALFFSDLYGGSVIGVLWKPQALQEKPFKISHAQYTRPQSSEAEQDIHILPNIAAILENFRIIGAGLVERIDTKTVTCLSS